MELTAISLGKNLNSNFPGSDWRRRSLTAEAVLRDEFQIHTNCSPVSPRWPYHVSCRLTETFRSEFGDSGRAGRSRTRSDIDVEGGRAGISRAEFGFTREKRRSATSDEVARRSVETSSRPLSGTIAWDSRTTAPLLLGHVCTRDSRVGSSHGITASSLILPARDPRDHRESTAAAESDALYEP